MTSYRRALKPRLPRPEPKLYPRASEHHQGSRSVTRVLRPAPPMNISFARPPRPRAKRTKYHPFHRVLDLMENSGPGRKLAAQERLTTPAADAGENCRSLAGAATLAGCPGERDNQPADQELRMSSRNGSATRSTIRSEGTPRRKARYHAIQFRCPRLSDRQIKRTAQTRSISASKEGTFEVTYRDPHLAPNPFGVASQATQAASASRTKTLRKPGIVAAPKPLTNKPQGKQRRRHETAKPPRSRRTTPKTLSSNS